MVSNERRGRWQFWFLVNKPTSPLNLLLLDTFSTDEVLNLLRGELIRPKT